MTAALTLRQLAQGYWPILLSFAAPQLILQTDLVMVASLGETATAAYALPMRVALLDAVLMMALGSVTSVMVAAARRDESEGKVREIILGALAIAVLLGVAVAALGVVLYPYAAHWVADDPAVAGLAAAAMLWFALAAPFRFAAAVAVMALHALGEGARVVRWKLAEVTLNAVLNGLFIFVLALGFVGAYLATFFVLMFGCAWSLFRLWRRFGIPCRFPARACLGDFLGQSGWEAKRVLSAQLFALVALAFFATAWISPTELARLSAFSAGAALALLLFMPLVALFRLLAFKFSGQPAEVVSGLLVRLVRLGLPPVLILAVALHFSGDALGQWLYGLSGAWWSAVATLIAAALPLRFINALQRAALQANRGFADVAVVDAVVLWCLGLPLIVIGLHLSSPLLAFSFLALTELAALPLFWWRLRPRLLSQSQPAIAPVANRSE